MLSGYEKPEDQLGEDGLFRQLKKALLEPRRRAERAAALREGDPAGSGTGNSRNRYSAKTVLTDERELAAGLEHVVPVFAFRRSET